jgi:hypothetical protein
MSAEVEFVILPAVAVGVAVYGGALAAAELGKGTADVAVLASQVGAAAVVGVVDTFRSEYRGALADVEARVAEEEEKRRLFNAEASAAASVATARARATYVEGAIDASSEMVKRQAEGLLRRAEALPGVPAALVSRCREAAHPLPEGDDVRRLAADIAALSGELAAYAAEAPSRGRGTAKDQRVLMETMLVDVRELLSSEALLVGVDPRAREAIEAGLQSCEGLAERQSVFALQGLAALHLRLRDELAAARGRAYELESGRAALVAAQIEIEAQLQTVRRQARHAAYRARAERLLVQLHDGVASGISLERYQALRDEAERLFTQSAADLATAAIEDFAVRTVRDVLTELGIQVDEIEGGSEDPSVAADRFVADVGEGYAVEFVVRQGGEVHTELVGLGARTQSPEAAEERACGLANAVMESLRRRKVEVAAGRRRGLSSGRALREVSVAASGRRAQRSSPKARTVDGRGR